ncbi:MAG: RHS repeat-associated core domain-containing protein, partial [Pseudomonas fluorescens]
IGATLPNGSQATYRYDAFGRRISKTVDGNTTEFFWQGDHLVAEHSREHHRSYVYEPGTFRPLAMLDGKGPHQACPFYYQLDHLGTPQELTDYSGDIIWAARYTAYGRLTRLNRDTHQVLDQPLRFQGQYFDAETGLHYNRHRYYNPDVGRYLTPDPSKLAGGLNGYQYTRNPTGWVDPLGLSECPGGDECKRPAFGDEDPAGTAKVDEGEPDLPSLIHDIDPSILLRTHSLSGKGSTKRVENIAKDMRETGFDTNFPIDVAENDGKLYILDGHHRASAARQTSTRVIIKLVRDVASHRGSLNSIDEVLESANNVGHDRLEHRRR